MRRARLHSPPREEPAYCLLTFEWKSLPISSNVWGPCSVSSAAVHEAIRGRLEYALDRFDLVRVSEEISDAYAKLEAALESLAGSEKAFRGDRAQRSAEDHAKARNVMLDAAYSEFEVAVRAWVDNSAVDTFIRVAKSFDGPEPGDSDVSLTLQLRRFEFALSMVATRMRAGFRELRLQLSERRCGHHTFSVRGDPRCGVVTVRCPDPDALRALGEAQYWDASAAVRGVIERALNASATAFAQRPEEATAEIEAVAANASGNSALTCAISSARQRTAARWKRQPAPRQRPRGPRMARAPRHRSSAASTRTLCAIGTHWRRPFRATSCASTVNSRT